MLMSLVLKLAYLNILGEKTVYGGVVEVLLNIV